MKVCSPGTLEKNKRESSKKTATSISPLDFSTSISLSRSDMREARGKPITLKRLYLLKHLLRGATIAS